MIPNIWKNKECSKPPTSIKFGWMIWIPPKKDSAKPHACCFIKLQLGDPQVHDHPPNYGHDHHKPNLVNLVLLKNPAWLADKNTNSGFPITWFSLGFVFS
jgi:hypothetical protein